jgi:hypothetical protein
MFTLASKKNEIGTKISKCLFGLLFRAPVGAANSFSLQFPDPLAPFAPTASPQEKLGILGSWSRVASTPRAK